MSSRSIAKKAEAFEMANEFVDGMDVMAVETAVRGAVEHVRAGNGPYLLECRTYRFRAHSMYDPELYRSKEEVEEWKKHCAIETLRKRLQDDGNITDQQKSELETFVSQEIDKAVAFAESGPWEPVEDLLKDVLTVA